jgi:AraC-like DNA-binding protein
MPARAEVVAWRPAAPGISEVLHAHFTGHAYPMHTHEAWTLLLVDDGTVRYDLGHQEHAALGDVVTLLPPHVPHNGCDATSRGFRKRVVYLDADVLGEGMVGPSVDRPTFPDPVLRRAIHGLHRALARPGDELAAEARLALVTDRLARLLAGRDQPASDRTGRDGSAARGLRDLLDAHVVAGLTLRRASAELDRAPSALVRAFGREFGTSPHQYLVGRRVDLARHLLLARMPVAQVAVAAGFYDQPHLTHTFVRVLGVSPARYARSAPAFARSRAWRPGP